VHNMPSIVNGNRVYDLSEGEMVRVSGAFSPDTGRAYRPNTARISSGKIAWNTYRPKIYYTHSAAEVEVTYAQFLTLLTAFDVAFVGSGLYTKGSLGVSFQGRDMPFYRLGPISRKHIVIASMVHGNEHDGIKGEIKAMEILATAPEWGSLRDEWTIFWIPVVNPDGYNVNTRNNRNIGPNGQFVNINRNWDWFWPEYVEDGTESKGTAPESEIETQNILNYWRTGNAGAPVVFGFVLDVHGNKSPGARYQSRDRVWSTITGTEVVPTIPGSETEIDLHAQIWKIHRGIATQRVRLGTGPNFLTQTLHSRFNPVMHSYFSSKGVPSMVIEEVKVAYAIAGTETYATACDFRLDYVMAVAAALASSYWTTEDAVLLEPAATNLLTNPDFRLWSSTELRPQFWSGSRVELERQPYIEGQIETGERHLPVGESIRVTADVDLTLPVADEFTRAAATDYYRAAVLCPIDRSVYHLNLDGTSADEGTFSRLSAFGVVAGHGAAVGQVDFIGGGTAVPTTGAVTTVTRVTVSEGSYADANVGVLNTARMFAAGCDNYLADPAAGAGRVWVFGGYDAAGNRLTSIEEWNPATLASTTKAAVVPAARADAIAVYYPPTGKIYIFGGSTVAAPTGDTIILVYDPVLDAVSVHVTTMTVALLHASGAYSSGDGKIYVMSGQTTTGAMSDTIYSFDPDTGDYTAETSILQELDNEDDEDGSTRPWDVAIGRNCALGLRPLGVGDDTDIFMPGGRLVDGAGAVTDYVYVHDVGDGVIGKTSSINYGYVRPNTSVVDTRTAEVVSDTFATGPDPAKWSDPSGAFTNGGGYAKGVSGVTGWLIGTVSPTLNEQDASVQCRLSIAGVHPDLSMAVRATFAAGVLTAGYRVSYEYNAGLHQWVLYRVVGGVATVLSSLNVTGTASLRPHSVTWRTLTLSAYEGTPVEVVATFNGSTILTYYDFSAGRIAVVGDVGLFGGST
jgi:hypothetical protein